MRDTLAVVSAVDIHLAAAIGTVEQACERSSFAPSIGVSSDLASDFLCKVESLLADNGFMSILENRPFVLRHIMAFLTPEELEEIRKREERKDKLHQNYLKRKASGAQKRYEDKIKAAKKAEMDEKKNAIRAEDIARGVFIPVSNLPKREPQKGAITA